ncbi:MAG: TolC family protein [Planctomycetes bacterium]|nr:TolC family protein [Planctomycetota bacterium]
MTWYRSQRILVTALFASLGFVAPSSAQEQPETPPIKSDPTSDQDETQRPAIPTDQRSGRRLELTLGDCFALGDRGNLDLALDRLQKLLAAEDIAIADAFFEPEFFTTLDWRRTKSPPRNAFQPSSTSKNYGGNIGVRKTFVTGGSLEVSFQPRYVDQRVASSFSFPTTFFTGDLTLSASQPLLRGAWGDSNLAEFEAARLEELARIDDHERRRQEILEAISAAYFELVFRREDYVVRYQSLELSREQLANTEQKIRLGELAPRDRVADQAEVAKQEEELIRAENSILDGEDDLRRLVLPFREDGAWDFVIVPTDVLGEQDPEFTLPTIEDALEIARASRPDLKAQQQRVEAAEYLFRKAEQDALPQLDLNASYRTAAQRDDYHAFQRDIYESIYPEYSVSVNFVLPLGNKAAKGRRTKAMLEVERSERARQVTRVDIEKAVRTELRALATLKKSIAAATESARLARSDLESEQIKLRLGEGVRIEVQRRNQQYQDARSLLLRARLDYRSAWFRLLSALGRIDATSFDVATVLH